MAKKGGGKKEALLSPLFESGTMNGPMAGPKGGERCPDPLNYLNSPGKSVPGGSPGDRTASSTGERSTAH